MKARFVVGLAATLLALPTFSQTTQGGGVAAERPKNANCGLLYGKGHALTFCAPKGWVLDNQIMNDQGIYAVFYPDGSTFAAAKDSGTFMYINVVGKGEHDTLAQFVSNDAADVKKNSPSAVVQQGDPIRIGEIAAPVQLFAPGGFNRYEAVAYLDSPKALVMFVISSTDRELFAQDYPAFVQLVQSYKFLGSDVTINHQ